MAGEGETDRLSAKFSFSYKVLVQLFPTRWDVVLQRIEQALEERRTAQQALALINVVRGLPPYDRKALLSAVAADRREIRKGQQSFHTSLTTVSLEQLARGEDAGFFSYVPSEQLEPLLSPAQLDAYEPTHAETLFVSHSTQSDGAFANALVVELERGGRVCWISPRDMKGGRWNPQVLRAVHTCSVFLALLSPQALESKRVLGEIDIAVSRGKTVVPVRLHPEIVPAEFDIGLQTLQYLDWFDPSADAAGLARRVLAMLGQAPVRPFR